MSMRRALGWILLVFGVLVALWAMAAIVQFNGIMGRFGIPLTWELISSARILFARAAAVFLIGAGIAVAGGWLVVRKPRPRLRNLPSHFE